MTNPFEAEDAEHLRRWLGAVPEVRAARVVCDTEDDWLAARIKGIGASEIGIITGVSSWTSPYALWWRKKNDWRLPRTEVQRWGHLVEDPIAELFAEEVSGTLHVAKPVGAPYSLWCHPAAQWMLCTPDRLAVNGAGRVAPVEIKSDEGGTGWGMPGTDEVPAHHRVQVMWQAHIFGADGGWVVRKRGSGKGRLHVYWVPYNPGEAGGLILRGFDFLVSIHNGTPPEPDGAKSTTETLKEIHPAIDAGEIADVPVSLFDQWHQARAAKRETTAAEARISNLLRAAMGRAEFAAVQTGDGFQAVFAKRKIGKRAGYSVSPGETDKLEEISHGQHDPAKDLRAGEDVAAGAPPAEEGPSRGDPEGEGLGADNQRGESEADPGSAEVKLDYWEEQAVERQQVEATIEAALPPELAELAERARRYKPNPHTTAPLADDSGAFMEGGL